MHDIRTALQTALSEYRISMDERAAERLCGYYDLLVEWNRVMNLTALTEPDEVALKHFVDSLMLLEYSEIPQGAAVIDVGTGAGFPGMVLAIARPDLHVTLLDSLQKRLTFLDEVCTALGLTNVATVHSRAEDGARTALRDSFDLAVARAVAPLNVLCEYCLPYVKAGGSFFAMKGKSADDELAAAQNAIIQLGGKVAAQHRFTLGEAGDRAIIEIKKITPTPALFPRKSKAIQKKPL